MRLFRLTALAVAVVGLGFVTRPYVHGLSFVIRAADMQGTARRVADVDTTSVTVRETTIPTSRGSMRARVYQPGREASRASLLVSGPHASGIDEPGLVRLARQLSASGLVIVTPDIPELSRFEISPAVTDAIEQSALWLSGDSGLAPDRKAGLMGIGFSGGLAAVAAGRRSLADRVSYVFAFGAHHDLPRVVRYLCTGQEPLPSGRVRLKPDATGDRSVHLQGNEVFTRPPHYHGVAMILLGVADRVVPAAQVEPLRDAVRRVLREPDSANAADTIRKLPEPSRTLLRYVAERDVVHLAARLLPRVSVYGTDPALSPSKSSKPSAPVFLLHDTEDDLIPEVESEYLAEDLRGHAPVRVLLNGLMTRDTTGDPVKVGDVLQLAGFWGDLLSR